VRAGGGRLGLVPTMGALHAGHAALMHEAARRADHVAVTIFVNPTQFGPGEDLDRYPRDLEGDLRVCERAGVRTVFAPPASEMYPLGERTRVRVEGLTAGLCGARRPGHFEGVTTIVAKLFAVAGPCVAVFGRKDYQQLRVIERMTQELLLPVEVVGHPTVREADGLALSSRNRYLDDDARRRALSIPRSLGQAVRQFAQGERRAGVLSAGVVAAIEGAGGRVDYADVADAASLAPLPSNAEAGEGAVLAVAAFFGTTRLIDNVVFGEDPPPEVAA
jgi:pantoate--beta-alanine ligase